MVHTLTLSSPSGRIFEQISQQTNGSVLLRVESFASSTSKPAITCVCSLPNSQYAVLDAKGSVYLLLLDQNRYKRLANGCAGAAVLSYIPLEGEGVGIAVGKEVRVFQLNGQLLATLRGHKDKVEAVDVNYLRKLVITVSQDTCILWEIGTWRRVKTVHTEASKYSMCQFTPDSQSVLFNLRDGSLYQMSLGKFAVERYFHADTQVKMFSFSSNFKEIYGAATSSILVWDTATPQSPKCAISYPEAVQTPLQMSIIDTRYLLLLSDIGLIYLIDTTTDTVIGEIRAENHSIGGYSSTSTGSLIFKASDGSARIMNLKQQIGVFTKAVQAHVHLNREMLEMKPASHSDELKEESKSSSAGSVVVFRKEGLDFNNVSRSSSTSEEGKQCQHQLFLDMFRKAKVSPEESHLQHCNLRKLLHHYGAYPEQYRVFIWRFLLQLPNNKEAFEGLYSKGMHPALENLHKKAQTRPVHVHAKLERVLSALTYWSPIFGQADYVPGLISTLGHVCRGDDLTFFEIVVACFLNWFQHWMEFYPTPPVNYLQSIDNVLKHHTPKLHSHFQALRCPPRLYIWPALQHLFIEFLGQESWIQLLDFLFTDWDKPQLLIFFSAAVVIKHKNLFLKMTTSADISRFFLTKRAVHIKEIAELAFNLYNETSTQVAIVGFDQKLPILQGQYPLFSGYPKFIVEETQGIRGEILKEEENLLRRKQCTIADLQNELADFAEKERSQVMKKEQIAQLDKEWRDLAHMEEELRAQERLAFDKDITQRKQQEIKEMEAQVTAQLRKDVLAREQELQRLETEVSRGGLTDQYALETKIAEEALRDMEQRALRAVTEDIDKRSVEEHQRRVELSELAWKSRQELEDKLTQSVWETEDEAGKLRSRLKLEQEAKEEEVRQRYRDLQVLESANRVKTLEHELQLLEVSKERRLREVAEEELDRGKIAAQLQEKKRLLLAAEESHHFSDLKRREEFHERKLVEERLAQIQVTTLNNTRELQAQQEEIQRLEKEKLRKAAEGRLIDLRKQQEEKAIDGERQFQEEILRIDQETRAARQLNQEKLFSQKEDEERLYFQRVIQNETLGNQEAIEQEAKTRYIRRVEDQQERTQKAHEDLEKWHQEQIQRENEAERDRILRERESTPQYQKIEKRSSPLKSDSPGSRQAEPSQPAKANRAVRFHSTHTSPDFTNRYTSPEFSINDPGSDCSCSCHGASGTETPPMPIRSVRDDYRESEESDGSELVLSNSESSYTSPYSSVSNSTH